MIRMFFVVITLITLAACSSNKNSENLELLDILKANEWLSSSCESHGGHPFTKHSITITDNEFIIRYLDFDVDCSQQFGEFTETRPFY